MAADAQTSAAVGVGWGAVLVGVELVEPHRPFDIGHRAGDGQVDQSGVDRRVGAVDAGDGPHRRIRQAPGSEGVGDGRAGPELSGDAEFLVGGRAGHVGPPHQPGDRGELPVGRPALIGVEVGQGQQPRALAAVHLPAVLHQPHPPLLEGIGDRYRLGRGRQGAHHRHRGQPRRETPPERSNRRARRPDPILRRGCDPRRGGGHAPHAGVPRCEVARSDRARSCGRGRGNGDGGEHLPSGGHRRVPAGDIATTDSDRLEAGAPRRRCRSVVTTAARSCWRLPKRWWTMPRL